VLDATGLELIAQDIRGRLGEDAVVASTYYRRRASLEVRPEVVKDVVAHLREGADEPFDFLASLHGCDYFPDEPRLGVHYELLSMERTERLNVKCRLGAAGAELATVVDLYPGANLQEREVFDFFGVRFAGHPDLRRSHMPEDYEGHPLRRDFPVGGEPVLFTHNQPKMPRWYE